MKNSINIILLITVLIISMTSCEKSLELEPVTSITEGNFWKRQEDATAAIVGCYDALQPDSYYGFDMYIYGDVRSDNCFAGGDNPDNFAIDNFSENATNGNVARTWDQIYIAIGRTNDVIEQVAQMDENLFDEGIKDHILGEAYFLRGLHYFNLVRLWGSVPLVISTPESIEGGALQVEKASIDEIYAQVINDFETAQSGLLSTPPDTARIEKGAAEAFLAKVALRRGDNDAAIRWTDSVMTRGYSLVGNYEDLFNQLNKNNSEVIFTVQYSGGTEGNVFPELVLPTPEASFEFIKFNTPTPDSRAQFEAGDLRENSSVVERNGTLYLFKWRNGAAFVSSDYNIVMRYADVLLMRAEALNNNMRTAEAIQLLNQVRTRAGLPDYAGATDQPAVDQAIFQERRVELMYEGHRWFDLTRRGFNVANQAVQGAKGITITQDQLFLPIPQDEIDKNGNLND